VDEVVNALRGRQSSKEASIRCCNSKGESSGVQELHNPVSYLVPRHKDGRRHLSSRDDQF
jgi:hypothetical protein